MLCFQIVVLNFGCKVIIFFLKLQLLSVVFALSLLKDTKNAARGVLGAFVGGMGCGGVVA